MRYVALALFLVGGTAMAAAPPPGRYAATLCVSTAPKEAPSWGAANL